MKKPEVLALIPARGGSKGIPRKNIRDFAGHPLIAYSIAAGLQAATVGRVIVSTDDEEIAAVARAYGAETPFLRPTELAGDAATDLPVFEQALAWLAEHESYHPEVVVQLRPTSPIRPLDCVDDAVHLLQAHPEADCVRGVVPAGQNPHKMWRIDATSGHMQALLTVPGIAEPFNAPRQALPPVYWQTGHIDAVRTTSILEKHSLTGDVLCPLIIDPRYTVDLDNLWDWARSEWLVAFGGLAYVSPGRRRRSMPKKVSLLVLDFDGVLTDNRVWVDRKGRELVAAYRSDSLGLNVLRREGIEAFVLSMETDQVVAARCRKMKVPYIQGESDKARTLKNLMNERNVDPASVVYLGNDINDLPCFPLVGWAVAVADALPDVLAAADHVLSRPGGHGAVRELCDLILNQKSE
ncbi:MAG: acylneuraminate cytidylyltransferase [Anaerolineales bacterium]|nr:acylneuraminate cytidylyltransferase [Anaerolineales bacterium]